MNEKQEELTDAIIDFQVKHHVNDTDLAFASHLSVEKVSKDLSFKMPA